MLITVKLTRGIRTELMPVIAPRGAAAYVVTVDKTGSTASIIFAMMGPNESGLDALNRVLSMASPITEQWLPVAARPEAQRAGDYNGPEFVSYDFVYTNDQWNTATTELANFMKAMQSFQALPATPPRSLAFDLSSLKPAGKVKARAT
jgi:hypothetical protein